tara:strand:+ start:237 stop:887 length:651 start_codon:yes stop_codon:yes gene_type:complete
MYWKDEGYLLSKKLFSENSIIIEAFTLDHGKYSGIVYGGTSKKQKKNFQVGNKILLNWKSKGENKFGYFNVELINPITPKYFDDKKKSISILAASSILKLLLPEGQINKKIYSSFEKLISTLDNNYWIKSYVYWEIDLIKELGFEVNLDQKYEIFELNDKKFKIPELYRNPVIKNYTNSIILEALIFNKNLILENFIIPNRLKFPMARNILEKYFE